MIGQGSTRFGVVSGKPHPLCQITLTRSDSNRIARSTSEVTEPFTLCNPKHGKDKYKRFEFLWGNMAKHISIELSEEEHNRLSDIKDDYGLTWFGMLRVAGDYLDEDEQDIVNA